MVVLKIIMTTQKNKIYKQEEVNWCLQKCSLFIYISWQEKLSQKYSWELSPLTIIIEKKKKNIIITYVLFCFFCFVFSTQLYFIGPDHLPSINIQFHEKIMKMISRWNILLWAADDQALSLYVNFGNV